MRECSIKDVIWGIITFWRGYNGVFLYEMDMREYSIMEGTLGSILYCM